MTELGLSTDEGLVTTRTNVSPTVAGVTEPSPRVHVHRAERERARDRVSPVRSHRDPKRRHHRRAPALNRGRDGRAACRARATWDQATAITVYGAACDLDGRTLARFGVAGLRGVRWYPSLAPIVGIGFEIDAHSVGTEREV